MINATVSHELRNPLNSMICQIQYMNHNLKSLKQAKTIISKKSEEMDVVK